MHNPGPSLRGQALGSAVKLFHDVAIASNNAALSYRIKAELGKLEKTILSQMGVAEQNRQQSIGNLGVLVVVGIQEWEFADPTGTKARTFLSMHTGGVGTNFKEVLESYIRTPSIVQGVPRGWLRKEMYLWVTRESH